MESINRQFNVVISKSITGELHPVRVSRLRFLDF
jgi:hypothetical protein